MKKPKLHRQETSYSCMVACLNMVLDFYGIEEDESSLRKKSKTKFYGTHPINIVECAKSFGFEAYVNSFDFNKLQVLLRQNLPVITNIIKHDGDEFYIHSVVVYRIERNSIYLLDPEDGEIKTSCKKFETLWGQNDYIGIVISKKDK
ncbi:C39 family peptidase [candidate division KSB1 bacterium]|nr:C39 family peptidase [candidate division KSB1 bacterium]MBL7093631.1 C39 family peptidase [candidate division KSB1 bacterium]